MESKEIATKRLLLRKLHKEDRGFFYKLLRDQKVNRFLPWLPIMSMKETEQFLKEKYLAVYENRQGYAYVICLKESGMPVGIKKVYKEKLMKTREEAIRYALTFPEVYRDEPFHDPNWTVIRKKKSRKVFLWIFEREGHIWLNVKADPEWRDFWREVYPSVIPAYHLNKKHWNSIILDGSVPEEKIQQMIGESYDLVEG